MPLSVKVTLTVRIFQSQNALEAKSGMSVGWIAQGPVLPPTQCVPNNASLNASALDMLLFWRQREENLAACQKISAENIMVYWIILLLIYLSQKMYLTGLICPAIGGQINLENLALRAVQKIPSKMKPAKLKAGQNWASLIFLLKIIRLVQLYVYN